MFQAKLRPAVAGERSAAPPRAFPFLIAAAFVLLVAWGWIGFLGSDDVIYARGAQGWLQHFPYVGGHGSIRYPITLPMALSFRLFGGNEVAFVLPSLLYLVGVLWIGRRMVARHVDGWAGDLGLLLLATMPLLVTEAGIANIDVVELFFVVASLSLFLRALDRPSGFGLPVAAGACAGSAFLSRETAIFAGVFYGLLFLRGYRMARTRYLAIAAGFLGVWALELLYLGVMTGDPLYRFNISVHHDSTIDRSVDLAGNVLVHPAIDPLLVVLINQEFMALFWAAIPAGLWLCFARAVAPETRRTARTLGLFGLVWFVCVGAAVHLLPLNPRYFLPSATAAALLVGIAARELWMRGLRWTAALGVVGLVAANLLGIFVENRHTRFPERELVRIARAYPGREVHTDPVTRFRGALLLEWAGADRRVTDVPPRAGDLFLYNPASGIGPTSHPAVPAPGLYGPAAGWRLLSRAEPRPDPTVAAVEALGLHRFLPAGIWNKLRHRHAEVELYEVGPSPVASTPRPR